jgi:hypothetical protein
MLIRLALDHVLSTTNRAHLIDLFERRPHAVHIERNAARSFLWLPARVTGKASAAVERIRRRVLRALDAPLDPKSVDRILGITTKERLLWSEDGRLPTCGRSLIGHGNHQTMVLQFPIDEITAIASTPGLMESWRAQDMAAIEANGP